MNKLETIRTFTNSWTHPRTGEERLYLDQDAACRFIGLAVQRYKSGSIKHATLEGETISNTLAFRIVNAMHKAYYSVATGKWYAYNDDAIDLIIDKLAKMEKAAAQKTSGRDLSRRAMTRAHAIRREAAERFGCRPSEIAWGECLKMAWAEVRSAELEGGMLLAA